MKPTHLVALATLAVAVSSCSGKPCSGNNCLGISGTYVVTYQPGLDCALWAYRPAPTSTMVISQTGSQVQVTLQPSIESPTHLLTGTLFEDGTILVTEAQLSPTLGIPAGQLSGSFTSAPGAFTFQGTLTFIQNTMSGASDAGPNNGCSATVNVNAQRTSASTVLVTQAFDGGSGDTDGGP
ncbi:MAG: hypothetical protein JST54_00435 [Deltaproteobacteria bacterium]|nr:hypothetical protein [Deltaproteobacteria bacterium]